MKKALFLMVSFLFLAGCASAPVEQLQRENIVELPGMSKAQIYNKSLQWVASHFNSANDVIQYKDLKEGSIVLQIITTAERALMTFEFDTTLTIDIKDNKARLSFQAHSVTIDGTTRGIYGDEPETAQESFEKTYASYSAYMSGNKKNW